MSEVGFRVSQNTGGFILSLGQGLVQNFFFSETSLKKLVLSFLLSIPPGRELDPYSHHCFFGGPIIFLSSVGPAG